MDGWMEEWGREAGKDGWGDRPRIQESGMSERERETVEEREREREVEREPRRRNL